MAVSQGLLATLAPSGPSSFLRRSFAHARSSRTRPGFSPWLKRCSIIEGLRKFDTGEKKKMAVSQGFEPRVGY